MAAGVTASSTGHGAALIDRGTVKPALLVLAFAVLLSVVLPRINASTSYRHEVHRGDVAELADGLTLVPTPGWSLTSGALAGHTHSPVGSSGSTELIHGSVDFYVQVAPFAGTPSALLTRVDQISADVHHARGRASARTHRYAVTTRQRVVGVAEDFVGVDREGSVIAFVFTPRTASTAAQGQTVREGAEIVVSGPPESIARRRGDILAMMRSVTEAK